METLLRLDAELLLAAQRLERRGMHGAMRALTRAGDTPGWIVHGLLLLALLDLGTTTVATMAAAAALATAASQAAKRLFRRARPGAAIAGFVPLDAVPDPYSFPSGHSTVAFAIATAAVATTPLLGAVEVPLATSIAFSRVYLGAHYPVDVIAGIALGFACGLAATALPF